MTTITADEFSICDPLKFLPGCRKWQCGFPFQKTKDTVANETYVVYIIIYVVLVLDLFELYLMIL